MANKKKLLTSGVAVVAAVGVLFGGTFAWQSISQQALNEVSASVNPGGRLHDDFKDISDTDDAKIVTIGDKLMTTMTYDKDVYVENFTEYAKNGVQVYARVRLDEYMEMGAGAGTEGEGNEATPLVETAKLAEKNTWQTYKYNEDSPFRQYWEMDFGGSTVYMPTFNKNKDSLEADINGSFKANFKDHVDYNEGDDSGDTDGQYIAIYDKDAAANGEEEVDEIVLKQLTASQIIRGEVNLKSDDASWNGYWKEHIDIQEETHTAASTLDGAVISMETYLEAIKDGKLVLDEEDEDSTIEPFDGTGNFWVYDTDGWAYWANPIAPETATGLLLTGINRTNEIINQDWYYAINVVAQFITYDDMGQKDGSGFYDKTEGSYPSANALTLLSTIGVDVPEAEVANAEELSAALEQGGIITLTDDIELTEQLNVSSSCVLNLDGYTITTDNADDVTHSDATKVWSFLSVRDGATLVIEADEDGGVTVPYHDNGCYAIDVRDGSRLIINGGNFAGIAHTIYVHEGEAVINGGTFALTDIDDWAAVGKNFTLNCYDENYQNGAAKITVYGGTFKGFDPANCLTEGAGTNFVAEGYESNESDGWYTVTEAGSSTGE